MPNDAFTLHAVTNELNSLLSGGKITKIFQPENDEIILHIHNNQNYKLLISANAGLPRIHLITQSKENPFTSPNFCMQLRKHLTNGVISKIYQNGFERQIILEITCKNELFDTVKRSLIVEIMNRCSNIILTDENSKITAVNKTVTPDLSSIRQLMIGLTYTNPPKQNKTAIDDYESTAQLLNSFDGKINIFNYLSNNVSGLAKSTLTEVLYRSSVSPDTTVLTEKDKINILNTLKELITKIDNLDISPCITLDENSAPIDFSAFEYLSLKGEKQEQSSINSALENFYHLKDKHERFLQHSRQLQTTVKNELKKNEKKLKIYLQKQSDCSDYENERVLGELLTANIYKVKKGDECVTVDNYYNNDQINIQLDKQLYPSQNAQKYFKLYSKKKKTSLMVVEQLKEINSKIEQLSEINDCFRKCNEISEIDDIKNELIKSGFMRELCKKSKQKQQKAEPKFLKYSISGYTVLVGKNNTQNDELTFKTAKPNDLWFHTKSIHGSHVVIQNPDNESIPDDVIKKTCEISAYFSKGFQSSNIDVDCTLKKYVKKPSGSAPGFVTYTNQKTVNVTPNENLNLRV